MKLFVLMLSFLLFGTIISGCYQKNQDKGDLQMEETQRNKDTEATFEKPYYDEWIDYTAEDLQNIFWEHENAFEYVAQVILGWDRADFYIVVDSNNGDLLFYSENPDRLFIQADPRIHANNDGSDFGYIQDELFESYENVLLVTENFSRICVSRGSRNFSFGHNDAIYYAQGRVEFEENTAYEGNLKENWFYYIQSYV